MKKILIITYYWPPSGGSGVQRWMYFARHLSDFGYEPVVLTVDENKASYKNTDEAFLERVKHVKAHRTNTFEPLKLYSLLTTGSAKKGIPQGHVGTNKKGVLNAISTYIRGNFFIPDARVGWNRFALKAARRIIKEENISLVVTTGPPHSTHLTGLKLKRELDIIWIADLRDPWSDLYYNKDLRRTKSSTEKDKRMESAVLNEADRLITVGIRLKELFLAKMKTGHEKFHHIYNGYDSFLMDEIQAEPAQRFELTFIGLLTTNQPYQSMISALKLFQQSHPEAEVVMSFAGNVAQEIRDAMQREIPRVTIDHHGYVSHEEALKLMKRSRLLYNPLPVMKHSEIMVSGKLMEYVATGNPILCFGNKRSDAAMILDTLPNAVMLDKEEHEAAAEFIGEVYQKWQAGTPWINQPTDEVITSKSRYETTRQLAGMLDGIAAGER